MNQEDMDILAHLAESMLDCSKNIDALNCAETVLKKVDVMLFNLIYFTKYSQDPSCIKAMTVKAESLFNICEFEHALLLFTKARQQAPESERLESGLMKCNKTILNKLSDENVFFFTGSKRFIDHLRKEGENSVDDFINSDDSQKTWRNTCSLVSLCNKEDTENGDKLGKRKAGGKS